MISFGASVTRQTKRSTPLRWTGGNDTGTRTVSVLSFAMMMLSKSISMVTMFDINAPSFRRASLPMRIADTRAKAPSSQQKSASLVALIDAG